VEVDVADPGPGQVLVHMAAVGICGSDLHVVKGEWPRPVPMILGHAGAGVVAAVGEGVADVGVGDRVVLSWAPACGRCAPCTRGRPTACTAVRAAIAAGTATDGTTGISLAGQPVYRMTTVGALAEDVVVPASAALPLADDVTLEAAAVLGCAALTGVGAVEVAAGVRPGETVLVIGAGGVGQFVVQGARIVGASDIVVVDPNEGRLERALGLGGTTGLHPRQLEAWAARERPEGFDHAFEVVGTAETAELALRLVRPGGRTTLVGIPPAGTRMSIDPFEITAREKTLAGTIYGSEDPGTALPRLIEYARAGRLELTSLLGPRFPLDQVEEAVAESLAGSVGRVIVTMA
jgi:S-(hydroxymethyl)glutathione dehydrogenase/alcohol dehydrogenase